MPSKKTVKNNANDESPNDDAAKAPGNARSTADVQVPPRLIDQIVGQEKAVTIIKKAAAQKRNVLLVGSPGTGKSLMAQAMSELLPVSVLEDILVKPNGENENTPKIVAVKRGEGKKIIQQERLQNVAGGGQINLFVMVFLFVSFFFLLYFGRQQLGDVITAALLLMLGLTGIVMVLGAQLGRGRFAPEFQPSKLLVDNSKSETAPFMEATGARAGALLGDVRHDPFQSFLSLESSYINGNGIEKQDAEQFIHEAIDRSQEIFVKPENNYEAVQLKTGQATIVGANGNTAAATSIVSCNRYDYQGDVLKLTTTNGKQLIVTPEHPIAVKNNGEIEFKTAESLRENDEVLTYDADSIINEESISSTYDAYERNQYELYKKYCELRIEQPALGYKSLSKKLGEKPSKTRWWKSENQKPISIQTVERLTKTGLLPFTKENSHGTKIAKVLGALYGDGGIFANLNGIFLSSSEILSVQEFENDLISIFGEEIRENGRIIEGGEYGHSWCYQNANRAVIRYFQALGAPVGNKTKINLVAPAWICLDPAFEDAFYGAFLGGEMGTPIMHEKGKHLTCLEVGITYNEQTEENRKFFLGQLVDYLSRRDVEVTSIYQGNTKISESKIMRVQLGKKMENVLNFMGNVPIHYSHRKIARLNSVIQEWVVMKKSRFEVLSSQGIGAEKIMKKLNLTPRSLYQVLNA